MTSGIIQSLASLILSGSMAVIAFVLYRITRDLLTIRTDMLSLFADLRSSGKASKMSTSSGSTTEKQDRIKPYPDPPSDHLCPF